MNKVIKSHLTTPKVAIATRCIFAVLVLLLNGLTAFGQQQNSFKKSFVEVSRKDSSYFCLSNGETYIPIGLNICWGRNLETMERYIKTLSENGGNYMRLWLGRHEFYDYEQVYGQVDERRITMVDQILDCAEKYGIKVKMCIENFREIAPKATNPNIKAAYHVDNGGPFTSMADYMTGDRGQKVFLDRVKFFKERYGNDPRIFAWEIWNEMNAIWISKEKIDAELTPWTAAVLQKMQDIFPKNLVVQSLGSMDRESIFPIYKRIMEIPENDFLQVHRYIDEATHTLPVCKGPMDLLAADAVEHLKAYGIHKPVLLAETGGVEPNHSGQHRAYKNDRDGMILHDLLFAPYFTGAAGTGCAWHWDVYVDQNNLWYHFRRFSNAIKGVDPVKEKLEPLRADQQGFRVYVLKGKNTSLVWVRDAENTWQTELDPEGPRTPPRLCKGVALNLSDALKGRKVSKVEVYNPWTDQWSAAAASESVSLPDFKRSIVLKIKH